MIDRIFCFDVLRLLKHVVRLAINGRSGLRECRSVPHRCGCRSNRKANPFLRLPVSPILRLPVSSTRLIRTANDPEYALVDARFHDDQRLGQSAASGTRRVSNPASQVGFAAASACAPAHDFTIETNC